MANRKKVGRPRKVGRPKRGAGFFSNIGNALSKAHDWVKSNKIISTVGNALGAVGVPYAGAIGKAAGTLGYGMKRRKRNVGGALNLRSVLSSAHNFVKDKKLISSALKHFGHNKLSAAANSLGYGKPKRKVVRKRKVGGSLKSILSSAHKFVKDKKIISSALKHFGHNKLSAAANSLGYGKKARKPRKKAIRHVGGAVANRHMQIARPRF